MTEENLDTVPNVRAGDDATDICPITVELRGRG